MKKVKILMAVLCMMVMVFGVVPSASALTITITPDTEVKWSGNENYNLSADEIKVKVGETSTLYLLYKADVGQADSESFASSYETSYYNVPLDPQDANISYIGGDVITGSPLYLYVKDGSANPAYYIYNLSKLLVNTDENPSTLENYSWNGTDTIELSRFWTGNGAISHIAIYGTTSVPEPTTLFLLGLGLIGVAGMGRKLKK